MQAAINAQPAENSPWFQTWFNSPYYHLLYQNRDEAEAQRFIDRLLLKLRPDPAATMLDLACGKGRYSRYLAQKGFFVTGLDIATDSIEFAQQFENEHLAFFQHDMRLPYRINYFDFIFNFFTSFGYFETEKDHQKTVANIGKGLRREGKFVLDFFNAEKVLRNLQPYQEKTVGGVTFHIHKQLDSQGYILKNIQFEDHGQHFDFTERVRAFSLADFRVLFGKSGMKVAQAFGSYHLEDFDPENSDRLILIGCKSGC